MKRWLSSIIDIRKGEVLVTTLMVLNIYLILVTYYLLKPARDSLFISVSGAKNLPLVFILIALVVVPVTTVYSRISRSFRLNQLINYTTIFIIINLFLLRWMISLPGQVWVVYAFYTWVSIYGALTTAQFWLLANAVYDASQAKRIFVLFGLAAIIGATTGGEITNLLIKEFGVSTENLLYFCVVFMAVCVFLVTWIWSLTQKDIDEGPVARGSRKKAEPEASMGEVFRDVKSSRYLMMIIGIIIMTMVTATFVDYLLKAVAEVAFTPAGALKPDKEELSAFFGKYYGRVSLLSFLVQFFLSYRILKVFGVSGAIMFLPVSQLLAAVGMAVAPGLASGVILRGSGDVFKYSIDKTGRELLFLPVPLDVKKRVKVFIDVLIDRWFRGLAGGILYIFTAVIILTVSQISMMVIGIVLLWMVLVLFIRKQYINAFRQALDKGEIDPAQLTFKITDASTVDNLIKALDSDNARQVNYALGMLAEVQNEKLIAVVQPLLKHADREVRSRALRVLGNQGERGLGEEIRLLLSDEDAEVRIEAMHYIYLSNPDKGGELLRQYLKGDDFYLQSAALGCIARYASRDEKSLITGEVIERFLNRQDEHAVPSRKLLAAALGTLDNPLFSEYLLRLLGDPAAEVVREAIAAIGHTRDREFLPQLLNLLSDKHYRADARAALVQYGNRILGTLNDYLSDPAIGLAVRRNVPRVMMHIPTQQSVDTLTSSLTRVEPGIRHAVIRALNRLRDKNPELDYQQETIRKALDREAQAYYQAYQIQQFYPETEDDASREVRLLRRALRERLQKNLERIFRLLALIYPAKDVFNAYQGVQSANKNIRASGIEFLENLLQKDIKEFLMPILDETSPEAIIRTGRKRFRIDITNRQEGLVALARGKDPWLKACAIYAAGSASSADLQELIEEAAGSSDALVRETALLVAKSGA